MVKQSLKIIVGERGAGTLLFGFLEKSSEELGMRFTIPRDSDLYVFFQCIFQPAITLRGKI